jgi:hypothetical protein
MASGFSLACEVMAHKAATTKRPIETMLRIVENLPSLIVWFRVKISAGQSSVSNADYAHHPPGHML